MVCLEGKSYQEVAELLNISIRSVEYELKKALTKMKHYLCDYVCAWSKKYDRFIKIRLHMVSDKHKVFKLIF